MSDHKLLSSFAVSSIIHLMLVVPAVSLLMPAQVHKVQLVPVQLVDVPPLEETKKTDVTPPQPTGNQTQGTNNYCAETAFQDRYFRDPSSTHHRKYQKRN